ncbi:hypothetical protein [Polymorphospora sp. NPDC050346]|uniref:hypothetical protein n=1 Tax=Polymorphospora sp. NPDC050346 TaxID=3155780 RepID=UPI0033DA2865
METTFEDLSRWFDQGVAQRATHLIVVCDTFDYTDFPVYVQPGEDPRAVVDHEAAKSMQGIHEVYDLRLDKATQLQERRALRLEAE